MTTRSQSSGLAHAISRPPVSPAIPGETTARRTVALARRLLFGRACRAVTAGQVAVMGFFSPAPSSAAPTALVEQMPVRVTAVAPGVVLVDFDRVAFGNLRLLPPSTAGGRIVVRFGEALSTNRVERNPPGSVRYYETSLTLNGEASVIVSPPANARNTTPPAVPTPPEWGVLIPFRWVEIEGWPGGLLPEQIRRRAAFASTWDDSAAQFSSSDDSLNSVWELCRYSIKATTFAGLYVDGDRERISYEADAYINQLGAYACDVDLQMARDTFDHLLKAPTWPTEWALHMVLIAQADWMQTGDIIWLGAHYEALRSKLLMNRARADGLIASTSEQIKKNDIVDWPASERDGFVFEPVNTVVNAFHLKALALMAEFARVLGKDNEASEFQANFERAKEAFDTKLFNRVAGVFRDGEGTDHASLHANMFPLAFGLVAESRAPKVITSIKSKGMACSVYGAQYLLEALFTHDEAEAAIALITAPGDRSWRHMVESGTTITWEAWDQRYKPNQDWSHAWGAAPANLLPRFILGVQPSAPGWKKILLRPNPGSLSWCSGKVPTPRGPVLVTWSRGNSFKLTFTLPEKLPVRIELPAVGTSTVWVDGKRVAADRLGDSLAVDGEWTGTHTVEVR